MRLTPKTWPPIPTPEARTLSPALHPRNPEPETANPKHIAQRKGIKGATECTNPHPDARSPRPDARPL